MWTKLIYAMQLFYIVTSKFEKISDEEIDIDIEEEYLSSFSLDTCILDVSYFIIIVILTYFWIKDCLNQAQHNRTNNFGHFD